MILTLLAYLFKGYAIIWLGCWVYIIVAASKHQDKPSE